MTSLLRLRGQRTVKVPIVVIPMAGLALTRSLAASKGELTPPDLKDSFNGGPLVVPEQIKIVPPILLPANVVARCRRLSGCLELIIVSRKNR